VLLPRRSPAALDAKPLLARGEKEIAAGQGYDLEEVLDEADALLARAPK